MTVTTSFNLMEVSATSLSQGGSAFGEIAVDGSQLPFVTALAFQSGTTAVSHLIRSDGTVDLSEPNLQIGEVATLGSRNTVFTYQDGTDVFYKIVNSAGGSVLPLTSIGDSNSTNPSIAALASGGFAIATQDNFSGLDGDIDVRIYDAAGALQSSTNIDTSGAADRMPDIIQLANGNIVVAWYRIIPATMTDPQRTEVWNVVYDSSLATVQAAYAWDSVGEANQNVALAAGPDGYFLVYEDSERGPSLSTTGIDAVYFNNNGAPLISWDASDFLANGDAFLDYQTMTNPHAVFGPDNHVLVSFTAEDSTGQTDTILRYLGTEPGNVADFQPLILRGVQPQSSDATNPVSTVTLDGLITTYQIEQGTAGPSASTVEIGQTLVSDGADDSIRGGIFDDRIFGNAGNDDLVGDRGDDTIYGGVGDDGIFGADGNDTIFGEAGNDFIFSGDDNETIYGGVGDDQINGELGRDTIFGGAGDDRLYADERIETGAAEDMGFNALYGGQGNDTLEGDFGGDLLDGGPGADTMEGGRGNDIYVVDNIGDRIIGEVAFSQGGGIDTIRTFLPSIVQPTNIELIRLGNITDTANQDATGNDAPGTLVGNAGNNELVGRGGNDQINGNGGKDRLTGNTGRDTLVGGAGADTFVYSSISESRAGAAERDVINGFDRGQDLIDLRAMDANLGLPGEGAFTFLGTGRFTGTAGELRLQGLGGPNAVLVEGDVRGDGVADFQIFVNLTTVLGASDFIL